MHDLAKAELEEEQEVGLFELQRAGIQGLLLFCPARKWMRRRVNMSLNQKRMTIGPDRFRKLPSLRKSSPTFCSGAVHS